MRDLFLLFVYVAFFSLGLRRPFLLACGYIWVDLFTPQMMGFGFMQTVPVSLIIGATTFASIILMRRGEQTQISTGTWLLATFAIWITLTTIWAEVPAAAWVKWNTAFKTVAFAALLPFVIKTRTHVETVLLIIVFSVLGNTLAAAVKVLRTGGGYGLDLGLFRGNSGLVEGSTMATIAVSVVPILMFMRKHSSIFPRGLGLIREGIFRTAMCASIICTIGTFTRSGLVAIGVLLVQVVWNSKHKVVMSLLIAAGVSLTSAYFVSDAYKARMNTISTYNTDGSAMTRLGVWAWTIDYAATHPWGGGFDVWIINGGRFNIGTQGTDIQSANTVDFQSRAFHSIYFEVLGEHGLPGMALFLGIIFTFFGHLRKMRRLSRGKPELEWAYDLSRHMRASLIVYLCGATFVGIAFQPFFYEIYVCAIAVSEYVSRMTFRRAEYTPVRVPTLKPA